MSIQKNLSLPINSVSSYRHYKDGFLSGLITICLSNLVLIFLKKSYFFILTVLSLHCCAQAFSGCSGQELLIVAVCRLLIPWLLLLQSTGSRVRAQYSWRTGLVTLRHVGSSQTRNQTCVPCSGRRILNQGNSNVTLIFLRKNILIQQYKGKKIHP